MSLDTSRQALSGHLIDLRDTIDQLTILRARTGGKPLKGQDLKTLTFLQDRILDLLEAIHAPF